LLGAGCTTTDSPSSGPVVSLVDSIVLAEPPGDPLGGYTAFFAVGTSGAVFVTDVTGARVAMFDPTGAFVRWLGSPGEGPGEFRAPNTILSLPDRETIAVMDANRSRILVFREHDGAFVREIASPIQGAGGSIVVTDSTIVLAPLLHRQVLMAWHFAGDSFAALSEQIPFEATDWQRVAMSTGIPGVAMADSTLVLWQPAIGLSLHRQGGEFVHSVEVPALRRRGEGQALTARQQELRNERSDSMVISGALGIGTLTSGELVLVSMDADRTTTNGRDAREHNIRMYLTVLDPAITRACVDGLVPLATDALSTPIFRDDAVHFLARQVTNEGTVRSIVYRYRVDVAGCEWVPLGAGGS
jgi:hypothetical protein